MPVLRRAQRTVVWLVELADQVPVKIDLPDSFAPGPQRDLITPERFTDKAHTTPPINLAALLHPAQQPGFGITWWEDAAITTAALAPALCRGALAQGFMRTFLIVVVQPALAARLLPC